MGALQRLDDLIDKFDNLERELDLFGEHILSTTEVDHLVVDMNIAQLDAGKDSNDFSIIPEYKESTIAIKKKKGQVYTRVTLQDKRDFKGGMKARNYQRKLEIVTEDDAQKAKGIFEKYGDSVFGLNKNNMAILRGEKLKPEFQLFTRKYFNL